MNVESPNQQNCELVVELGEDVIEGRQSAVKLHSLQEPRAGCLHHSTLMYCAVEPVLLLAINPLHWVFHFVDVDETVVKGSHWNSRLKEWICSSSWITAQKELPRSSGTTVHR